MLSYLWTPSRLNPAVALITDSKQSPSEQRASYQEVMCNSVLLCLELLFKLSWVLCDVLDHVATKLLAEAFCFLATQTQNNHTETILITILFRQ